MSVTRSQRDLPERFSRCHREGGRWFENVYSNGLDIDAPLQDMMDVRNRLATDCAGLRPGRDLACLPSFACRMRLLRPLDVAPLPGNNKECLESHGFLLQQSLAGSNARVSQWN